MTTRPYNFSPGPAIIPQPVMEQAAQAVLGLPAFRGLSVLEISHRLPEFEAIVAETTARLKALMRIPDTHVVVWLQGGARGQFAQVPLNWLRAGASAGYVDTGVWASAAYEDAKTLGDARLLASGKAEGYTVLPDLAAVDAPAGLAYVHTTSNNTIYGTQWRTAPEVAAAAQAGTPDAVAASFERRFEGTPHVCDISSDILSRDFDVGRFAMLYAGTQKNAGIAGLTVCVIEKAFMDAARSDIPSIWQYRVQHANDSMYNTPPTFAIYCTLLTLRWIEAEGGVAGLAARNTRKADALYAAIDGSGGFYRANIRTAAHRSQMNVTWRLPSEDLEKRFIAEAEAAGLHHLKGHRKAGGLRASLYNALPEVAVDALVSFMDGFRKRH
ncbi:MAG: 3-phosphoserine/phosphohydroxythreonine transaminase [Myxococcota bacterium]